MSQIGKTIFTYMIGQPSDKLKTKIMTESDGELKIDKDGLECSFDGIVVFNV